VASASLILVVALPSRRHLSNTRWKVSRKRAPSSQKLLRISQTWWLPLWRRLLRSCRRLGLAISATIRRYSGGGSQEG
jgi:hypothetical protein